MGVCQDCMCILNQQKVTLCAREWWLQRVLILIQEGSIWFRLERFLVSVQVNWLADLALLPVGFAVQRATRCRWASHCLQLIGLSNDMAVLRRRQTRKAHVHAVSYWRKLLQRKEIQKARAMKSGVSFVACQILQCSEMR